MWLLCAPEETWRDVWRVFEIIDRSFHSTADARIHFLIAGAAEV
jgi:hypothetical protein